MANALAHPDKPAPVTRYAGMAISVFAPPRIGGQASVTASNVLSTVEQKRIPASLRLNHCMPATGTGSHGILIAHRRSGIRDRSLHPGSTLQVPNPGARTNLWRHSSGYGNQTAGQGLRVARRRSSARQEQPYRAHVEAHIASGRAGCSVAGRDGAAPQHCGDLPAFQGSAQPS